MTKVITTTTSTTGSTQECVGKGDDFKPSSSTLKRDYDQIMEEGENEVEEEPKKQKKKKIDHPFHIW